MSEIRTVRMFYDSLTQGFHYSRFDEDIIVPDSLYREKEVKYWQDRFKLYSDRISPPLEELFDGDKVVDDLDPYTRITESNKPWTWKGQVPRTPSIMRTMREKPERIYYTWLEGKSEQANECFDKLKFRLFQLNNQQYLTCYDGPCAGDRARICVHESRMYVQGDFLRDGSEVQGSYVYERGLSESGEEVLKYVRTDNEQIRELV